MTNLRDEHRDKEEKEDYSHPWYSSLSGSAINLVIGLFSLVFLFWLGNLFMVGVAGTSIPGSETSKFGTFTRRAVYETVNIAASSEGRESQAAAMARTISDPAKGMMHLENLFSSPAVQQLAKDKQFAEDLLSGDAQRIEQNAALQQLFDDRATLDELKEMGLLSGNEKKTELCAKLSKFGSNEKIRASIESLQKKKLFSTDKITLLLRDPDFDVLIGEMVK